MKLYLYVAALAQRVTELNDELERAHDGWVTIEERDQCVADEAKENAALLAENDKLVEAVNEANAKIVELNEKLAKAVKAKS